MAVPAENITEIAPREDRERRARVQHALRTGLRVPSADLRDGEYYTTIHQANLAALAQARQLTATECLYLFALMAHTHRTCPWAVVDYYSQGTPTLGTWAAWLGGMTTQQVYNARRALHAKGIILYVDGDPMRVMFNPEWETWQAQTFCAHTKRAGAGRKPATSKLPNLDVAGTDSLHSVIEASSITECRESKSPSVDASITECRGDGFQAGPQAAPASVAYISKNPQKQQKQKETPANAGGAADAAALDETPTTKGDQKLPIPKNWPATQPGDSPKDVYRRALLTLPNKAATVAYMAHLSLGVPHTRHALMHLTGTQRAMTAVANVDLRWGLIGKAIVDAIPKEIIGDPLDYVHRTALGLAQDQARGGAARATRAATGSGGGAGQRRATSRLAAGGMGSPEYWQQRSAAKGGQP